VVVRTLRCMPSATIQLAGNSIVSGFGPQTGGYSSSCIGSQKLTRGLNERDAMDASIRSPEGAYSEALGEVEDGSTFRAYGRITANR
jgi:hypothetical protein